MSSDKFQEWLSRVWGPNTDDVRRLLVLDQAPIHKTQAARDALDEWETDVASVPAGCTSILQPADVYWNRPFKANLRRSWEEFMRRAEKLRKEICGSRRVKTSWISWLRHGKLCQRKPLPRASRAAVSLTRWMAQRKAVCMAGCPTLVPFPRNIAMGCRPNAAAYFLIQTLRTPLTDFRVIKVMLE
ncbi:hypothetical protein HPB52_000828 [Rhipicephalus sanguineus]|uniref:DDE-1 domain-containing protein n=1 Tax=Rhipicephalus sanguineus TaxID=34632 RepID=A0A9D4PTQ5_RHISA|nr:hypothetical protein HPB52_000828 [Rhipicephalus sanguineus]